MTVWPGRNTFKNTDTVTIKMEKNTRCHETITSENWLSDEGASPTKEETFEVAQLDTTLVIKRSDTRSPWDLDLQFVCCGNVFIDMDSHVSFEKFSDNFFPGFPLLPIPYKIYFHNILKIRLDLE